MKSSASATKAEAAHVNQAYELLRPSVPGAADFKAEQDYHVNMRRMHSKLLHTWGVLDGLEVTATGTTVNVAAGRAIDGDGFEIILSDRTPLDLSQQTAGTPIFITIAYKESPSEPYRRGGRGGRHADRGGGGSEGVDDRSHGEEQDFDPGEGDSHRDHARRFRFERTHPRQAWSNSAAT